MPKPVIPRQCERTSCQFAPRWRVIMYKYRESTPVYACDEHAEWWIRGWGGMPLGTKEKL